MDESYRVEMKLTWRADVIINKQMAKQIGLDEAKFGIFAGKYCQRDL